MPESLNAALVQLALALVSALTLAITVFVVPALRAQLQAHESNTTVKTLKALADSAVRAVEQTSGGESGGKKYVNARGALMKMASDHGIAISAVQADALLEEAVMGLRLIAKSVDAPPLPSASTMTSPARVLQSTVEGTVNGTPKPAAPRRTRKPKEVTA